MYIYMCVCVYIYIYIHVQAIEIVHLTYRALRVTGGALAGRWIRWS